MKQNLLIHPLLFVAMLLVVISGCEKDDDNGQENVTILSTIEVTEITVNTATSGGNITDDGGTTVIARGVCWSTNKNPTIDDNKTEDGTGVGSFTSSIKKLEPNTTYYVRAYATNSANTGYGSVISFTTQESGVTDIDGNTYETVTIGDQTWMAENLKVTHYADGTSIPLVTDNTEWANLGNNETDKAYCYYKNNVNGEADIYGVLYTYAAATNGDNSGSNVQGVCPDGWHLPSSEEWTQLTDYLEGENVAGGKLKEIGTIEAGTGLWFDPNSLATNETGFSALPGGARDGNGAFSAVGSNGYWWSATEYSPSNAYFRVMLFDCSYVTWRHYNKGLGLSVRCVRD
jgi:uncharacterized protein (TIGR02145 family)